MIEFVFWDKLEFLSSVLEFFHNRHGILFYCYFLLYLLIVPLYAWPIPNGIAVCTAADYQNNPSLTGDGLGGTIITWHDSRTGFYSDIYAQRVDYTGVALWTLDGIAVCTIVNDQSNTAIVSDGVGGAIITWEDSRNGSNYDIYAQRVNSIGSTLWALNGIPVCTAGYDQYNPRIVSDGLSGAIITWEDSRNGSTYDIYAQRINSDGSTLWTLDGVAICTAIDDQYSSSIVSDDSGGTIITWQDYRIGGISDIYAQRIDSSGSTLWTLNGVPICTEISQQANPKIISDGAGGAIIAWEDFRSGTINDIYAQRVNNLGLSLWTLDGIPVCAATNRQTNPQLVSDGAGGAVISWDDHRDGTGYDIYAQRVNNTGSVLWQLGGVAVCTALSDQYNSSIESDGASGAIITWQDIRNGMSDIYIERVSNYGLPLWTFNGFALCTAPNDQTFPKIVSDGMDGVIVTWEDARNGNSDIYVQQINSNGSIISPLAVPGKIWNSLEK